MPTPLALSKPLRHLAKVLGLFVTWLYLQLGKLSRWEVLPLAGCVLLKIIQSLSHNSQKNRALEGASEHIARKAAEAMKRPFSRTSSPIQNPVWPHAGSISSSRTIAALVERARLCQQDLWARAL